jgi:phosphomevalonate kinase
LRLFFASFAVKGFERLHKKQSLDREVREETRKGRKENQRW